MPNRIVAFDFAGTLIRASIIEEANKFRAKVLKRSLPKAAEHAHPDTLYQVNREFVEMLTGITPSMRLQYTTNAKEDIELSGEAVQNQIATTLFQIGMFMAAKKYRQEILPEGMLKQLQRLQELGYTLAIVSGVRTDIISGMLQIAEIPLEFDHIFGQPPMLGVSAEEQLRKLQAEHGRVFFFIGDKKSDLQAAKKIKAQAVFVTWGHASGGEAKVADAVVEEPEDLEEVVL